MKQKPMEVMLKDKTNWIIFLLLVIIALFILSHLSCNKPETVIIQRDSTLQKKVDSVYSLVDSLDEQLDSLNLLLSENEKKLINNYYIYKQREEAYNNLPADSQYNWNKRKLQERIRSRK